MPKGLDVMEQVPLLSSGWSGRSVTWCDVEQRGGEGAGGVGATSCGGMGIGREPVPRSHTDRLNPFMSVTDFPYLC